MQEEENFKKTVNILSEIRYYIQDSLKKKKFAHRN